MKMSTPVCLITGGTAGIGYETVRKLASYGATVVFTGRDKAKGEKIEATIKKETNNLQVYFMQANFTSAAAVNDFAARFKRKFKRLQILINNVGTIQKTRQLTEDGFEMTMFVNYYAPVLLTNALLNTMRNSAPARIINVSAASHQHVELDLHDLNSEKSYRAQEVYNRSKLALILYTYALAERVESANITVNALHPGHVKTDLYKEFRKNPLLKLIENVKAVRPEIGAVTHIYLAASEDVQVTTGKYFINCIEKTSSKSSYDKGLQQALWEQTHTLLHDSLTVK